MTHLPCNKPLIVREELDTQHPRAVACQGASKISVLSVNGYVLSHGQGVGIIRYVTWKGVGITLRHMDRGRDYVMSGVWVMLCHMEGVGITLCHMHMEGDRDYAMSNGGGKDYIEVIFK